uniref:SUI1 domain-containing protein n=1 Tax=Brassica campestris TaxID=3711 RepID=M4D7H8_BRACM
MSSNGKPISEKPSRVETESVPGPINPVGTPYVSSSHSIVDPHSKQSEGEASVTSCLTKLSGKTTGSSGVLNGLPKSKNPNDPFADANAEDSGAGTKEYVHIRVQQRNGRKSLTTVQGLKKEYIYSNILKDLKKEFCCNGTLVQSHVHVYFTARYLRTSRKSFVATVHWLQTQ